MNYRQAFHLIKTDYSRYARLHVGGGTFVKILKVLIHERGFRYSIWLRLVAVKGWAFPFCWLVHHHLSSKFGIQISKNVPIGEAFYIGHGVGIVVNGSAKIGSNVTICQFLTIGSTKGKAAVIENNVYIGPNVCLVEDVTIGHSSVIGAGAVVVKDIPDNCVAAGNPARVIKRLNSETGVLEKVDN